MKLGVGADKSVIQNFSYTSGGNGTNYGIVDVKDGKILRTRRFDSTENYDREELGLWTITKGDKTYSAMEKSEAPIFTYLFKQRALSPNHMTYPLKREDWSPENPNTQNRGVSKFVRISWEEALDTVASQIKRQYEVYGPGSIFIQCDGHGQTKSVHGPHGCMERLLELCGGFCLQSRQADSWEGWYWGAKHIWGMDRGLGLQGNLLNDITQNTELLLVWGGDADTTPMGWGGFGATRFLFWCTEIGIRQIYICPDLNYSAACHADRWIPVWPNTDQAMQWAIVHTWLKEDLWDKEYVATHAVGMEYIERHALGQDEDGIEKTPEWAEGLCGVPARTIKALARAWHKYRTTTAHGNGGSYIRAPFSHEPARMEIVMLGMQGVGAPGRNQFRMVEWGHLGKATAIPYPRPEVVPNVGGAYNGNRNHQPYNFVVKTQLNRLMVDSTEPQWWFGTGISSFPIEDQFVEYCYPPDEDAPLVHMIWSDAPCHSTCWNAGNADARLFQNPRIEFIVMQHPWLENDCLFADILLPVTLVYEEDDLNVDIFSGDGAKLCYEKHALEKGELSGAECYSDWEIVCMIAERLGMLEQYTPSTDVEYFIKRGFERSGIADYISYEDWRKKEYFVIPTVKDWEKMPAGFRTFHDDPAANPLETPSGKMEFYSEQLAEYFPDDRERRPYPYFIDETEDPNLGHHENRHCEKAKKYPFLLCSNHPHFRVHAQFDDTPWTREIELCKIEGPDGYKYEPVWINPKDAEELGIKHGDIVKLFNDRGWTMGGAYVTERVKAGCFQQDHGARVDPIEPGWSDRGGANNLICPQETTSKNCVGEVTSGFLVGIEKVDVFELAKQYPEAFSRPYDPEYGLTLKSWVKGA